MTPDRVTAVPVPFFDPDPHPDTLARVLQGLRDLPVQAGPTAGAEDDPPGSDAVPLPRRR